MLIDTMLATDKEALKALSEKLTQDDLRILVGLLSEKDDVLRYKALLLLQYHSADTPDVYPYWMEFQNRLRSDNSYQRSIGALLLAENAKWDQANKLDDCLNDYLRLLQDEKPITVRQAIQALHKIVPFKPQLLEQIAKALMGIDLAEVKETMRKSVLTDIVGTLMEITRLKAMPAAEKYIADAMTGGILDKKSIKQLQNMR
jgi:hypothetical protein